LTRTMVPSSRRPTVFPTLFRRTAVILSTMICDTDLSPFEFVGSTVSRNNGRLR
jgi:hypothetical protein